MIGSRSATPILHEIGGEERLRFAGRRERDALPGLQGQGADRLVTRIDPGVVAVVAELRGHERHAAEELEQWKTHLEERSQRCVAGGDYSGDDSQPRTVARDETQGAVPRRRGARGISRPFSKETIGLFEARSRAVEYG
jgi:hypothetical protein